MICYVVKAKKRETIDKYLASWGQELADRVTVVHHEDLTVRARLPRGTYVFSDIERLTPAQVARADAVAGFLEEQGMRVVNRPGRVLGRSALLAALFADGVNRFRALPALEAGDARYPLFLRHDNAHDGALSELLRTPDELKGVLRKAAVRGRDLASLLAVEFCDTVGADGVYRKYSAFVIGDRFIPRHVLFSQNWMTKYPDLVGAAQVAEEQAYLYANPHPHEAAVRAAFARGSIDYGRIDYGTRDGAIQVWEIITNPTITVPREKLAPGRIPGQTWVAERLGAAFRALDAPAGAGDPFVTVPQSLRTSPAVLAREHLRRRVRMAAGRLRYVLNPRRG